MFSLYRLLKVRRKDCFSVDCKPNMKILVRLF